MAEHFEAVEVDRWDLPLVTLPNSGAVRDYLTGKGTEAPAAADASEEVEVPLTVTKRAALVWGTIRS